MDKKARIAINGFGRIGRAFFKLARSRPNLEIVAVNDLGDLENMAYLLKYDTAYGRSPYHVEATEGALMVDGKRILCISERDPLKLPWGKENIDIGSYGGIGS